MPSSLSCAEVREKSAFHDGIFDACWLKLRPIRVRKVCASGTNGVGRGIRIGLTRVCKCRACEAIRDCVKGRRKDGMDRNWGGLRTILADPVQFISWLFRLDEGYDLPSIGRMLSPKFVFQQSNPRLLLSSSQ